MTPGDRRTIEELAEVYELDPKRRDIYVEGQTDVYLFRWFLGQTNSGSVVVYEISTVEIPVDLIKRYKLDDNNRDRVIVLAFVLASHLGEKALQITCIADRDFDLILNRQHNCGLLLFTDYTCIEMYSFDERCMDKFLNICICGFPHPADYVLGQLSLTLQELFLIRLANKLWGLGFTWMPFKRCCKLRDGEWWKPCCKCGSMQHIDFYYKRKDGVSPWCKECCKRNATENKRRRRKERA